MLKPRTSKKKPKHYWVSKFYTISGQGNGLFKEKGSKFISFAFPVSNEADIKSSLDQLKNQYHDARHHCYAWILGMEQQRWRANDDGEPNHSAGDPILGQIRSFGLTNTLVVVVRYFGGTKLGVSGLIEAYKTAANDALQRAKKIEIIPRSTFEISFPYELTSNVERVLSGFRLEIEKEFTERCSFKINCKTQDLDELTGQFSKYPDISIHK